MSERRLRTGPGGRTHKQLTYDFVRRNPGLTRAELSEAMIQAGELVTNAEDQYGPAYNAVRLLIRDGAVCEDPGGGLHVIEFVPPTREAPPEPEPEPEREPEPELEPPSSADRSGDTSVYGWPQLAKPIEPPPLEPGRFRFANAEPIEFEIEDVPRSERKPPSKRRRKRKPCQLPGGVTSRAVVAAALRKIVAAKPNELTRVSLPESQWSDFRIVTAADIRNQCGFELRNYRIHLALNRLGVLKFRDGTGGRHHEYFVRCRDWGQVEPV